MHHSRAAYCFFFHLLSLGDKHRTRSDEHQRCTDVVPPLRRGAVIARQVLAFAYVSRQAVAPVHHAPSCTIQCCWTMACQRRIVRRTFGRRTSPQNWLIRSSALPQLSLHLHVRMGFSGIGQSRNVMHRSRSIHPRECRDRFPFSKHAIPASFRSSSCGRGFLRANSRNEMVRLSSFVCFRRIPTFPLR